MRTVIVQATAAILFKGNQGLSTRPTSSSSHLGKLPSSASFSALISQLSKRAINSLYTHVRHTGPRSRASSVLFVPPCGGQDFTASSEPYQFLLGKKNNPKGIMYFLFFISWEWGNEEPRKVLARKASARNANEIRERRRKKRRPWLHSTVVSTQIRQTLVSTQTRVAIRLEIQGQSQF